MVFLAQTRTLLLSLRLPGLANRIRVPRRRRHQSSEPDYESVLSALESKIKSRETHLLSIRLRERRANALFITYGLAAWAVYVFLWWLRVLGSRDGVDRAFAGIPIIGGPVV